MNCCPLCQKALEKDDLDLTYDCPRCGKFIMSFGFVSLIQQLGLKFGETARKDLIARVKEQIKKNKKIVIAFVESYEKYADYFDNVLEISDLTSLDVEGNSRGSDYGD